MDLSSLIEEAKQVYESAGLASGQGLLPPAEPAALADMAQALAMPIPAELRALYQVHGGQEYVAPGTTGLFGEHRQHTPAEVVEHYQMFAEHCLLDPLPPFPPPEDEWGYWVPALIPFASWDANELCIHAQSGEVWEFIPDLGLTRHLPSIAAALQELITAIREGQEAELGGRRGPG